MTTPEDPDAWRQRAACREHDPDLWFPNPGDEATREAALRICRYCPVMADCRAESERIGAPWGIWGGETQKQRSTRTGIPSRVLADREMRGAHLRPCGTHAAYMRHLHSGEKPCQPCIDANRRHCHERELDRYRKSVERRASR